MEIYRFIDLESKNRVINFINLYFDEIKKQFINKSLNLNYAESILLSIADGFFLFNSNEKEIFDEIGYFLCKYIKEDLEKYGIYKSLGMLSGFGYTCFCVNSYSNITGNLKKFSNTLNNILLNEVYENVKKYYHQDLCVDKYDLISGISGNLYYLLDCNFILDCDIKKIKYIVRYLVYLSLYDNEFINYFISKFDSLTNLEKENSKFKNGSLNFGLSHGIIAPLVAISKAYSLGFIVSEIEDSIKTIYSLYNNEHFKIKKNGLEFWPSQISMDEYLNKTVVKYFVMNSSWCYGNFSIYRCLYKTLEYYDLSEKNKKRYLECLYNISIINIDEHNLLSPSLCHGYAGVLCQILQCYYETSDCQYLKQISNILKKIESLYNNNNLMIEKDYKILMDDNNIFREGFKYDFSLLEGRTGIVLSFLNLFNNNLSYCKLLLID
ncbi:MULTISPECIES: lanthionine synthetase LanC family protein [unclassified Clostridioides]|uniref:lanthionine synthetase LanC family protein n=1 Tax=unclassified Clostridioides TaxID=2635829 RepID=UPI001D11F264|nr:hypothetical protein JJC01_03440 [Clostridioides sp. ES-S-0010-02]UDN61534.1 hypothetical protein IC758_17075 [Clostridioides sp. ES-W-0016-02]